MSGEAKRVLDNQLLLETIDALKARKARPDKTRICTHIERKYGYDRNTVLEALSAAVSESAVIKVKYKDYYSYRNPEKPCRITGLHRSVPKKAPDVDGRVVGDQDAINDVGRLRTVTIQRMLQQVRKLVKRDPSGEVSTADILNSLHAQRQLTKFTEGTIKQMLRTLAGSGGPIQLLPSGKVTISQLAAKKDRGDAIAAAPEIEEVANDDDDSEVSIVADVQKVRLTPKRKEVEMTELASSSKADKKVDESASQPRARPFSTRKKKKKSLGPDFLDPSDLGYGYLRDSYEPKCNLCNASLCKVAPTNDPKQKIMMTCCKCSFKAHPSCFEAKYDLDCQIVDDWLCRNCKAVCGICNGQSKGSMIFCDDCQEGYHMQCTEYISDPKNQEQRTWLCRKCYVEECELDEEESKNEDGLLVSESSPVGVPEQIEMQSEFMGEIQDENDDPSDEEVAMVLNDSILSCSMDEIFHKSQHDGLKEAIAFLSSSLSEEEMPDQSGHTPDEELEAEHGPGHEIDPDFEAEPDYEDSENAKAENEVPERYHENIEPESEELENVELEEAVLNEIKPEISEIEVTNNSRIEKDVIESGQGETLVHETEDVKAVKSEVDIKEDMEQIKMKMEIEDTFVQEDCGSRSSIISILQPEAKDIQEIEPKEPEKDQPQVDGEQEVATTNGEEQSEMITETSEKVKQEITEDSNGENEEYTITNEEKIASGDECKMNTGDVARSPNELKMENVPNGSLKEWDEVNLIRTASINRLPQRSSKDASDWTIDDVENYIREIGFSDQAPLFKEQEIDGRSLLLLKRMDVLTGLSMKLGPALKIYAHIYRLQGFKLSSYCVDKHSSESVSLKNRVNLTTRINGNSEAA